jgi:hypothetical protein
VNENLEVVAVEPVQSILSPEPHKPVVVLEDLADLNLGQSFGGRETGEPNITARNNGQPDSPGIYVRLLHFGKEQRKRKYPEHG